MGDVNRDFTPPAFMVRAILVFLVILVVLACLLVGAAGWLQRTDGVPRVEGEIAALSVAIQNYFNDHGDYPRTDSTDELDPRIHGNPATGPAKVKYQRASLDLYSALSGDYEPDKQPDFKPERKVYYDFKPNNLSTVKDQEMRIKQVRFIQDPWGNSYGFSTARSKFERQAAAAGGEIEGAPLTSPPGYNRSFDLWSTHGKTRDAVLNGEQRDVKAWTKNW